MKNKRYNSINDWLKGRFGERIYKVSLNSGCLCPNLDGTIGTEGCIFCNLQSHNPAHSLQGVKQGASINRQLEDGLSYVMKRHGATKVIAYFQSGSNTHMAANLLAPMFKDAISNPHVVGLAVSTRPDCIGKDHIELLRELGQKTFLWVELGLQSSNDDTLKLIGRGHGAAEFSKAAQTLRDSKISICAHVILGLPGENIETMLETAKFLNEHKVWGVKIHNLHVLRGTRLEKLYNDGKVKLPTLAEYADWVVSFLEVLDPGIIIHRVNSHSPRNLTVAPDWSVNKLAIFNKVEEILKEKDSWQGKRLTIPRRPDSLRARRLL